MRTIALLGSTGSIGVSTLALVREFPERFKVHGMVAGRNMALLARQIKEFSPAVCGHRARGRYRVSCANYWANIKSKSYPAKPGPSPWPPPSEVDVVLAAIVGGAGLMPTLQGFISR